MEIETAPRPPAPTPWGRLALLAVLLGPVTIFVLLPIGLGLQRYVMTGSSMAGSIDRGSVTFERVVPMSDIQVGDVVTYLRPGRGHPGEMVTHRVVSVDDAGLVTRGDAETSDDPWVLPLDRPTISRVEFTLPWIGWAYLVFVGPWGWVLSATSAVALVLLTRRRRRTRGPELHESTDSVSVPEPRAEEAPPAPPARRDAQPAGHERGEE